MGQSGLMISGLKIEWRIREEPSSSRFENRFLKLNYKASYPFVIKTMHKIVSYNNFQAFSQIGQGSTGFLLLERKAT